MTAHNERQKRSRLTREITHYSNQIVRYATRSTSQEKRCHTRAVRALRRRIADLDKLISAAATIS
jgi:predicted translin family RNA/ssDNA-binding protein